MSMSGSISYQLPNPEEHHQSLPWYIIHTYSRHEVKVENGLMHKGLEVFLPRVKVRSRRRDRVQMLEVPLFSGYLFVHSGLDNSDYYHIIQQEGVVRILGNKAQYTPVPDYLVESIRTLINSGQPVFPWAKLAPGKRVRVVDGPLAGSSGVIVRFKKGKTRLVINVELLGRAICSEISEEAVEICG